MKRRMSVLVAALGLTLTVGAGTARTPENTALAQTTSAMTVGLGDYVFDPSALTVPAGDVTFTLSNTDSRRHDMSILFNGEELTSDIVQAGDTGAWTVTLDQPGTYDFWCTIGNHRERGMVGTLTVQ